MSFSPVRFLARAGLPAAMLLATGLSAQLLPVGVPAAAADDERTRFELSPNPAFVSCLVNDPRKPPIARVRVDHGELNDTLHLTLRNIKPHLAFDLFTVQRSTLDATGRVDPSIKNFGLAWYQSDVETNDEGNAEVTIKTILLNQPFGFDPDFGLQPINTFHVGFWFNNPNDAAPCEPDPKNPIVTPFNGEHTAGPLAMISLPNAQTGLGPLCIQPDLSGPTPRCNP